MVPIEKVKSIILRHDSLEKELSSGNIDTKLFAEKSKEYSNLKDIISIAREYVNFSRSIVYVCKFRRSTRSSKRS